MFFSFPILTVEGVLGLINLLVRFSYSIVDLLIDGRLETVEALLRVVEITTIRFAHGIDFRLKFLTKHA